MSVRKKKYELNWLETIEEAQIIAKETGKPIFAYFTGSDWCPWCVGLYEYCLNTEEFANYAAENLILVLLDFPKKIELGEERKKYCKDIFNFYKLPGLPTILLLDSDKVQIGQTGYNDGNNGISLVNELNVMLNSKKGK